MMKKKIEIKNLDFTYDEGLVLKKVNISIEEGKFIGVIGPNGGGKTTFLKLIMGLLDPTRGKIRIFNENPSTFKKNIGYVPQSTSIDKTLPVSTYEFILLGAVSFSNWIGKYPPSIHKRCETLLKMLNLSDLKGHSVGTLSGGEMQKALFARALISDPKLLILDEPTSNIDEESEKIIFDLLLSYKKKKTILMVNHDLETVVKNVDSILVVEKSIIEKSKKSLCNHVAYGLYHKPLIKKGKK